MAAKDVETQKKGIVCVHYNQGRESRQDGGKAALTIVTALDSLVVKIRAIHLCYDDVRSNLIIGILCRTMEKKFLCRLQSHLGTDLECQYSLMAFGVPLGVLPIKVDGNVDFRHHQEWLERHSAVRLRLAPDSESVDSSPRPGDVLLGRGRRGLNWPGNVELRKIIKESSLQYEVVDRYEKQLMAHTVYHKMAKRGARFLKPLDRERDLFLEVEQKEACDRIAHLFRNLRANTKLSS